MAGLDGHTRTYRLNQSVRVAKFTPLISDPTDTGTTTGKIFAALATAANQGPVKGVTIEHWLEPNTFYVEDTDPSTITGTTPSSPYQNFMGGVNADNGPTVQYTGQARVYAGAAGIHDGDVVVIGDAYGRVNNATNLAIAAGTTLYPVGIAVTESTAINDVILVNLSFAPVVVP